MLGERPPLLIEAAAKSSFCLNVPPSEYLSITEAPIFYETLSAFSFALRPENPPANSPLIGTRKVPELGPKSPTISKMSTWKKGLLQMGQRVVNKVTIKAKTTQMGTQAHQDPHLLFLQIRKK